MPCEQNGVYSYKVFSDVPNDPALVCLRKLEQAAKLLGSNVIAVYHLESSEVTKEEKFEILGQMLSKNLPEEPTEHLRLYMKLGQPMIMVKSRVFY